MFLDSSPALYLGIVLLLGLTVVTLEEDGSTTATGFEEIDAELDQTVAEAALDATTPYYHPLVKIAKDVRE